VFHLDKFISFCDISGLHGDEDPGRGPLDCDTVQWCGRVSPWRWT